MADVELKTQLTLGGDAEYKKALKGINDELKIAKSGMAAATSAFAKNDKSIEANKTRQEELRKVFESQQKKAELIREEIEKLSKADGDNEADINKLKVAYNNATAQMNRTKVQMEQLEDATEEEAKETEKAAKSTGVFADKLKSAGVAAGKATFKAVAAGMAAVGAAAAAAAKSLVGFSGEAGKYVDDLNTLSVQTGVSTETLQKWSYAANLIDVDVSTMTGAMAKLTKQMGAAKKGTKASQATFKKLGISIKDSNGHLRDSEDVFNDAITALGKIDNETERDALAMDLFGKSAQELNPLIKAGGGALAALGDEAERTGYIMSDKLMTAAQDYQDAQDRMANASTALKNVLGATLAPGFSEIAQRATHMMTKVTTALQDGLQPGELETLMEGLQNEFGHLFKRILLKGKKFIPMFTKILDTVITTLVDNMPSYLETLLPSVTGLLQSVLDSLVAEAGPLATFASTMLVDLATFIADNLPKVAEAAVNVFDTLTTNLIDSLPKLIPVAIRMIAKLAQQLVKALPILVGKLPKIVTAIVDGLKDVDWVTLGTEMISSLATALKDACVTLANDFGKAWDYIVSGIKSAFGVDDEGGTNEFGEEIGENILLGICQGLGNITIEALKAIGNATLNLKDEILKSLGLGGDKASAEAYTGAGRNKNYIGAGRTISESVAKGIDKGNGTVFKSATGIGRNAAKSMNLALGNKNGTSTKGQEVGKYMAQGLADGIENNSSKISDAAKMAARNAYKAAKDELGIKSPSRVMMEVGGYYDEGFAMGITKNAERVLNAAQDLSAKSAQPNGDKTAMIAGAAASAVNNGGSVVNLNTTYSGPFTRNDAGVFGQTLARSLSGMAAVLG